MEIIVEYSDLPNLMDQIALYLEGAAKAERRHARILGMKRLQARNEYTARAIEELASAVRAMKPRRRRETGDAA